mgnify:CR=1 FL=1
MLEQFLPIGIFLIIYSFYNINYFEEIGKLKCKLVVLPENFALMPENDNDFLKHSEIEGDGPIQNFLIESAIKYKFWIVGGSIPIKTKDKKKVTATTFNAISVDGDQSTNDSVFLFSTSKVKHGKIYNVLDPKLQDFEKALHRLCLNLSKQIVVDGEGASKFLSLIHI